MLNVPTRDIPTAHWFHRPVILSVERRFCGLSISNGTRASNSSNSMMSSHLPGWMAHTDNDLGYANHPGNQTYFYTERGAFRREDVTRTDISLNYSFFINIGGGQLELFLQPEVINVFNEQAMVTPNTFTMNYRNDDSLETFNPFTETPVEGTHWRKGDSWGEAQSDSDYQQPRTFRFSVGLRF